jgi:poly-beta-hydroxybutyrate-responsive repressor
MGNLYRYVEPIALFQLKAKGKTHGYELVKALNEHSLTDSVVDPGALYRTLRRLEEHEYVISEWDVSAAGPAKRVYELTAEGEEHLREWIIVMEQLAQMMNGFVHDAKTLFSQENKPDNSPT